MRRRPAARSQAFGVRLRATSLVTLGVLASSALWASPPATAVQTHQSTLVSTVPAPNTPNVSDGAVYAIAQVGAEIILGGTFSSLSPADNPSASVSQKYTAAFTPANGQVTASYAPVLDGPVFTAVAGPAANEVYIGGNFTSVNGVSMRVALLNTMTGAIVAGWQPAAINGQISRLVLSHGRLFVGGTFGTVGGNTHRGLVALSPTTGRLTSYVNLSFTGHHNYGRLCMPTKSTKCAAGKVGLKSFDVSPNGKRLVAIGDFTTVGGVHRDQIAMLDLGKASATVDLHWATLAYSAECLAKSFDSYVRDVQFAPDGAYFVVVATGVLGTNSDGTRAACDAASRFNANSTGANVRPTWIDYTGEDSLWSVAITGPVVYVGGHERWLNNSIGKNAAGAGAVARPGIAALSPASGLPFSWNPGRDPRGVGTFALLATASGLWIGSDTDYIGHRKYFHQKLAFFPLAGGEALPSTVTPRLPGRVFLLGATASGAANPNRGVYREFNGAAAGQEKSLSTGIPWGSVDGAFTVGGEVFYGKSDGNLYERSFDGTSFGSEVLLDPFNDPTWDNLKTGSGQTYQSSPSTFAKEIPSVTSMFFINGRLYYTLARTAEMHWRWFEPESGVIGSEEFTAPGSTNWSKVNGAFLSHGTLYYADATTGELRSVPWSTSGTTGASAVVDASKDWASRGLFALAQTTSPTPTPVAKFSGGCGSSATCTLSAKPWADPDGGFVRYAWNFGDGTTTTLSGATKISHRFLTDGPHRVTLTVTDTAGASASTAQSVTVTAPIEKIRFVGSAAGGGRAKSAHVVVPRRTRAGDDLVLFDSYASATARLTPPAGWKLIGRTRGRSLTTAVYSKVAGGHDARRVVSLKYSRAVHSSLILAVYANTSSHPIERSLARAGKVGRTHAAPAVRGLARGSWAVGYWTQISAGISAWILPHGLKRRGAAHSPRRPADGAVLADLGRPSEGLTRLGSARSRRLSKAAAQWVIALRPALR
jgi:hypothetical protein